MNQLGIAVLYLVLLADNAAKVLGPTALIPTGSEGTNQELWTLLFAALMLPVLLVRSLDNVAWVSAIGFLSIIFLWGLVVVECSEGEGQGGDPVEASWLTVSQALGVVVFAFGGHPVFPSVQASMKDPRRFFKARHAHIPAQ